MLYSFLMNIYITYSCVLFIVIRILLWTEMGNAIFDIGKHIFGGVKLGVKY